jgi:hypothetical protein
MITFNVRGIEAVAAYLKDLPMHIEKLAEEAVTNYIVGDSAHGLRHEPYYKYVNRQAGFPNLFYVTSTGKVVSGYASAKQHRYVMAMIAKGKIRPGVENRSHDLVNSYRYQEQGGGYVITNNDRAVPFVVGDRQTRMHRLIGWRTVAEVAKTNLAGAFRHAEAMIKKWLREHPKR